ncbi:MAG: DUF308 domain-containing protein [Culicoidibacterales bacterium]
MKNKIWSILTALIYFGLAGVVLNAPLLTILVLIYVIGTSFLIGGLLLFFETFSLPKGTQGKSFLFVEGLLLALVGVSFLVGNNLVDAASLIYMMLSWFIVSAIVQIITAIKSKTAWSIIVIILNIMIIVFSVMAMFDPLVAAGIFIWTISFQFIFMGIAKILSIFVSPTKPEQNPPVA